MDKKFEIIVHYLLLMLCEITYMTQGCQPIISVPSEQMQDSRNLILCTITNMDTCTTTIEYMIFEKQLPGTREWDAVAEIPSIGTSNFPELSNGYTLKSRGAGSEFADVYTLTINPSLPQDSGPWRCVVRRKDGGRFEGSLSEFTVNSNNVQVTVVRLEPVNFVLTVQNRYKCSAENVFPKVETFWQQGGENREAGEETSTQKDYTWTIESYIYLTADDFNEVNVTCLFHKTSGLEWSVNDTHVPDKVLIPAVIEQNITEAEDDLLNLSCIASGSNVEIKWMFDKSDTLPKSLIATTEIISGDYSYGQMEALKSTLKASDDASSSCDEKHKLAGIYDCYAEGFEDTHDKTRPLTVSEKCLTTTDKILIGVFVPVGVIGIGIGVVVGVMKCKAN